MVPFNSAGFAGMISGIRCNIFSKSWRIFQFL